MIAGHEQHRVSQPACCGSGEKRRSPSRVRHGAGAARLVGADVAREHQQVGAGRGFGDEAWIGLEVQVAEQLQPHACELLPTARNTASRSQRCALWPCCWRRQIASTWTIGSSNGSGRWISSDSMPVAPMKCSGSTVSRSEVDDHATGGEELVDRQHDAPLQAAPPAPRRRSRRAAREADQQVARGAEVLQRQRPGRQRAVAPHHDHVAPLVEALVQEAWRALLQVAGGQLGQHAGEIADREIDLALFEQRTRIARRQRQHAQRDAGRLVRQDIDQPWRQLGRGRVGHREHEMVLRLCRIEGAWRERSRSWRSASRTVGQSVSASGVGSTP